MSRIQLETALAALAGAPTFSRNAIGVRVIEGAAFIARTPLALRLNVITSGRYSEAVLTPMAVAVA